MNDNKKNVSESTLHRHPYVSIVIPVYNEEENIADLLERIRTSLSDAPYSYELIVIDDGSTDKTPEILKRLKPHYPELRIVLFRRNFGQSAAMTAGFDLARGEIVVTMDGDLQNDPADIPILVERIQDGYDVVAGWRKNRKDALVSRLIPSKVANWLIGKTTGVRLHDYGCSLKAYRKEISKNLLLYGDLHRFIPVLASLQGARIAEVVVTHHPRVKGKSKYGIGRTYKVLLDLMLMLFFQKFATRPLQFFGSAGGLMFLFGMAIDLYLTYEKVFKGQNIGGRPLLLLGVLLILSGLILFCIGLLAELIVRTYYEASGKRIYAIREIIE